MHVFKMPWGRGRVGEMGGGGPFDLLLSLLCCGTLCAAAAEASRPVVYTPSPVLAYRSQYYPPQLYTAPVPAYGAPSRAGGSRLSL